MTGGIFVGNLLGEDEFGRIMSSTEWLVEHLEGVPLFVIPCFEPYLPRVEGDDLFFASTLYGSTPGSMELSTGPPYPGVRHLHHHTPPAASTGGRPGVGHPRDSHRRLPVAGGEARGLPNPTRGPQAPC